MTELINMLLDDCYSPQAAGELVAKLTDAFHIIPRDDSDFDPEKLLTKGWNKRRVTGAFGNDIFYYTMYSEERGIAFQIAVDYTKGGWWLHDPTVTQKLGRLCHLPRTQSQAEAILRLITGGNL